MLQGLSSFLSKIRSKIAVLTFDISMIPLAWYFAYSLRYNLDWWPERLSSLKTAAALGIIVFLQVTCFYGFKVYFGLWRFASLKDVARIIGAARNISPVEICGILK